MTELAERRWCSTQRALEGCDTPACERHADTRVQLVLPVALQWTKGRSRSVGVPVAFGFEKGLMHVTRA
jgi:hypothetical protein